jgi:hypothetical protein
MVAASFSQYKVWPMASNNVPGRLCSHSLEVDGEWYSFLANGSKKWAYKKDRVSFKWRWKLDSSWMDKGVWPPKYYRTITKSSFKALDSEGGVINRQVDEYINIKWTPEGGARAVITRRGQTFEDEEDQAW